MCLGSFYVWVNGEFDNEWHLGVMVCEECVLNLTGV